MRRLVLLIATFSTVVSFGVGTNAATAPITFRLAHTLATSTPLHQAALRFKELVESRTNKTVEVQVFPNQVPYGPDADELTALNLGTLDIALAVAGGYYTQQPEFQLFSLVYVFRDEQHAEKVFRGSIVQELSAKLLANKGVRILAPFYYFGKRELTANKPVMRPEDLKGLVIRVPNVKIQQEGLTSMGAQASPMNVAEVYLALKTGRVAGQENPLSLILANKYSEVQKYLILTDHIVANFMMGMSDVSFKRLGPDQQQAVLEAAKDAEAYNNELARKAEGSDLVELKKAGMTVIVPDKAAFIKATEPLRQKYAKDSADVYGRIQETK